MGFFGKFFSGLGGKKPAENEKSGDMRKATGAGPAIAAHSKDAKTKAATGQNPSAAKKKPNG
ncbi:hypothetical protein LHFGNBLO_005835 [Mesorhizobium sp. AR10]|uniref:hypothetical protein n=1 Tax=Mesorhizobium sp. AR10 TaxID=2865839 RepID=UPI00215FE26F|nr:hypothetical protein [Mesorhizobium sp. AR10]UVK38643.1 hypothetical protein LHFGNBLO_005835 [Mesorhizobium sp. AR10]